MQRYCAREDRSVQKVREKLYAIEELSGQEREEIIEQLIADRYLDERRFVENYIRSMVNQKRWGVQKIRHGLIRHRIPEHMIDRGLEQIDQDRYQENLSSLLKIRMEKSEDRSSWIRYLLQKGFEYDEIVSAIEKMGLNH